ncbi:MAG: sensor histidine kinase, partial [Acidimicrobiales bacterium]
GGVTGRSERPAVRGRAPGRLAWAVWGVTVASLLADLTLVLANRSAVGADSVGFPGEVALLGVITSTVGALIASRVPGNAIGWLFCAIGVGLVASILAQDYAIRGLVSDPGSLPAATTMAWLGSWLFGAGPIGVFVLLLFPNGHLPSPRWRVVAWLAALSCVAFTVGAAVVTAPPGREDLQGFKGPTELDGLSGMVVFVAANVAVVAALASAVGLVLRLRRSSGEVRQQLKWFVFAAGLLAVTLVAATTVPRQWSDEAQGALLVAFAGIPIGAGVAVLRYRLYDIDVVINKTLVFGALALFITVVYVGLVVGFGAAIGQTGGSDVGLSLAATAVVAVAFQPVRTRAQRLANRLVYGERATPYEVLSEFSQRMAAVPSTAEVLPEMARALAAGTGATKVEVWLRVGPHIRVAAAWPESAFGERTAVDFSAEDLPALDSGRTFGVHHEGELLGALAVAKPPSEPLTPAEEKLISDLATQIGLVLRNVRLTTELSDRLEEISAQARELRLSRQRIVAAQDDERRRLERNLHDGAQQQLVALMINLRLAESVAAQESPALAATLAGLKKDTSEALDNLRDLARGIYPPTLAQQGLVAAVSAQAAKAPLPVEVDGDDVGRYTQGVEAAVYFSCLEALQNVSKYAGASQARVRMWRDTDRLMFSVSDDGVGFDPRSTPRGSGLDGIGDRVAALGGDLVVSSVVGGGTTVTGWVSAADGDTATPPPP